MATGELVNSMRTPEVVIVEAKKLSDTVRTDVHDQVPRNTLDLERNTTLEVNLEKKAKFCRSHFLLLLRRMDSTFWL